MADVTRLEQFLNHIAHPEDPIPAPQTRMEHNLKEIAENKGGGAFVVELSGHRPNIITETTYAEVVAAISAGKTVYIHHIDYLSGYYIPASYYLSHDGDFADYVDIQGEWSELSPEDDGSGGEIYYRIVYRVTVTLYPNAENNGIELLGMKFEVVEV